LLVGFTIGPNISLSQFSSSPPDPPQLVDSTRRLALEQVEQLTVVGDRVQAVSQLQRLQEGTDCVVPIGGLQIAGSQRALSFISLTDWSIGQLSLLGTTALQPASSQQADVSSQQAEAAYQRVQSRKQPELARTALQEHRASVWGDRLALLQADLFLERGEGLAALQALQSAFPTVWYAELSEDQQSLTDQRPPSQRPSLSLTTSWLNLWSAAQGHPERTEQLLQAWQQRLKRQPQLCVQVLRRALWAAAMQSQLVDSQAIVSWTMATRQVLTDPALLEQLDNGLDQRLQWQQDDSDSGEVLDTESLRSNTARAIYSVDQWPHWQKQMDRFSNSSDMTPASKPVVGVVQAPLPYQPVIYQGRVFVHELTRLRTFELESGDAWPGGSRSPDLYDSQISPAAYLPSGYPLMGSPTGQITIHEDCLYARVGPAVTGWASRSTRDDQQSLSSLIGLDLSQSGRQLPGFPIVLNSTEFVNAEFEGQPIVAGELVISAICQRDQAGLRRSLVAFDRFSGTQVWKSSILGQGSVVGSDRVNLISQAGPVEAGGLIYFPTELGTVACVDSCSGKTRWITSYQRDQMAPDAGHPKRFRYRQGKSCAISKGCLYCLPPDCPQLLTLDACDGSLVWSTGDIEVADCNHLIGLAGKSLLLGGDRIVWLNRRNGQLVGQFPAATTPGLLNSLPQPRGLGRGCLVGDQVWWPLAEEIIVLQADPLAEDHPRPAGYPPKIIARLQTRGRTSEGCYLAAQGPWLLVATPGRLLCFKAPR
jgi:outer membrane protein assembly factor BamB